MGGHESETLLAQFERRVSAFAVDYEVEEVSADELISTISTGRAPLVVDVRAIEEYAVSCLPDSVHVGKGAAQEIGEVLEAFAGQLEAHGGVMLCAGGYTSARSIAALPSKYRSQFRNLHGGAIAYANASGPLLDPVSGRPVSVVHGYDEEWARYVVGPVTAVLPG